MCIRARLETALAAIGRPPKLVIPDSQAFGRVSSIVPEQVPLTSFSILFARYKGDLELTVRGAAALDRVKNGDRILISEGCTHHRQCDDIGTVKLPRCCLLYTSLQSCPTGRILKIPSCEYILPARTSFLFAADAETEPQRGRQCRCV